MPPAAKALRASLAILLWALPLAGMTLGAPVASARDARLLPGEGTLELAFSPRDNAEAAIVRALREARRSVHVQAFLFTSRTLARALVAAKRRGVAVELLTDREMYIKGQNTQVTRLARAGIPVWLEVRYAAAHNKVMVIDADEEDCAVITGSYNFTHSAQTRNAENLLIFRRSRAVAAAYLDNWRRHRADAVPLILALE